MVAFQKQLGEDDPVGSDDERARVWDAGHTLRGLSITDTVGLDGLATDVGQQWVGDRAFGGEAAEDRCGVVTDGHNLTAGLFDFLELGLQLDQLRLAEGSPGR